MQITSENIEVLQPIRQLNLYGYENYFDFFIKLFKKTEIPSTLLLSGSKGLGKSTFIYHFVNYLLSKNEENKYSINDFAINQNNLSFKLLNSNTHPNFFLIENSKSENDIKIEKVRSLLKFLNKSTYSKNVKIVMIDNAENLNLNSSNALLKAIEEPQNNTFFFIIHNNTSKILDTIKSRCNEFRIVFSISEKKNIFQSIIKQYGQNFEINKVIENCCFDTPGNLIKYFLTLNKANISVTENTLECIYYFIEKYKNTKDLETLSYLTLFIEKFYSELCFNNKKKLNIYLLNQSKILKQIDNMKKFNLDKKNVLIWVKNILQNDRK